MITHMLGCLGKVPPNRSLFNVSDYIIHVDGTLNKKGTIRYFADLKIKIDRKTSEKRFYITGLGNQKIILGFSWLKKHNPQINWKTGSIIWEIDNEFSKKYAWESQLKEEWIKAQIKANQQPSMVEEVDPQEQDNWTLHPTLTEYTILEYLGIVIRVPGNDREYM